MGWRIRHLSSQSWFEALSGPGGTALAAGLQSSAFAAGLALASAPPSQSFPLAPRGLCVSYQPGWYAVDFLKIVINIRAKPESQCLKGPKAHLVQSLPRDKR